MNLRLAALALLSASMIVPVAAHAGGHTADKFLQADTDGDNLVSAAEYTAKYEAKWSSIDANADGQASGEEYEAYIHSKYEEKQNEMFDKIDTDGDGMVSRDEMSAHKKDHKHKH